MTTVYLTDDALRDIVLETATHPTIETGGILLGHALESDWYIVEVLDPGPRSVRSVAYFEYNHTYASHLANKVGRRYKIWPRLLGLWHRHPGSLDTFSNTDDQTHREYLHLLQGAFISMLVNIDPDYRMTFYRVDRGPRYAPVKFVVGNHHFPPELLERKCAREVAAALSRPAFREPPPVRRAPMPPPPPLPTRQEPPSEEMPVQYQQPLMPAPRAAPPPVQQPLIPPPPPRETEPPRSPGIGRQFLNVVQNFLIPRSDTEDGTDQVRVAPYYRPYDGERDEPPPQRSRASTEQVELLDLLDVELDYLTEKRDVFQYHISPQEPGFRMEVKLLMTPTRPAYPSRVEFMFYYRNGMPVVAIEGREQPYQPGLLRRFYTAYDGQPHQASDRQPTAGQERPHDGSSSQRPRP